MRGRKLCRQSFDTVWEVLAGMFNQNNTHNERQEALQTVMRKGDADVGQQVHSAPQLNKLLARSPEEFNIFQQVSML